MADVGWSERAVAATAAYVAATAVTTPLEVAKCRQQAYPGNTSLLKLMPKIFREEGVRALFRGFGPSLLMSAIGC